MSFLAGALIFAAVGCLALSMPKHYADVFLRNPVAIATIALRVTGWVLLVAAFVPCILVWGATIGIAAWFGLFAAAILAVVALLTYAPSLSAKS